MIAALLACFLLPLIPAAQDAGHRMQRERIESTQRRMIHRE